MIQLTAPQNGENVILLPRHFRAYIENPISSPDNTVDWLNLRDEGGDYSLPDPVCLTFTPAVDASVVVRCTDDGTTLTFPAKAGQAKVYNLLIGASYEWYVKTETETSEIGTFRTDPQPPRMLMVEGVTNVRDFGGYTVADGRTVRQNRILRTSELDNHAVITDLGRHVYEDELGIRTDLDIRGLGNEPCRPVLDQSKVRWANVPLAAYDKCFTEEQRKAYGESFALLTDPAVYPLVIHCWGGIDRTGCWLFLLGAMLGMAEEDLLVDYELSSFSRWGKRSRNSVHFKGFLDLLMPYGKTLQEAATNYMLDCGLTEVQLDTIRSLLLQ